MNTDKSKYACLTILIVTAILGGCATAPVSADGAAVRTRVDSDPWETVNRGVFALNRGLDRVTMRPIARGYDKVTPGFVRRGVGNFFDNLLTPLTIVNQLLQGKGRAALSDTGRLLINTTVGVGGLFDPASAAGLEKHDEDFGQTLAVWGVPDGPFVMLPLFGPRTVRDALTLPLDLLADPMAHYENSSVRDKLWAVRTVHIRAGLLPAESLIEDSYDPYVTVRESWFQNRNYRIYDGDPPEVEEDLFDEFIDE